MAVTIANTTRVPYAVSIALNNLSQTPNKPVTSQTYTTMKAAGLSWAQYVSMREQGQIVEGPPNQGSADVPISIGINGVAALTF